mmetsp:Transcript_15075/g.43782  ORF Transcript_15075/g.43782 Transcript_15075/m.43782 type:complete len:80 (-) Transcript_15075:213-452(-)
MIVYLIMRCGGPIAWKSVRQECTSLSSCKAEVRATNKCAKQTLHIRLLLGDLGTSDTNDTSRMTTTPAWIGPSPPQLKA